jgi:hypothetical protein
MSEQHEHILHKSRSRREAAPLSAYDRLSSFLAAHNCNSDATLVSMWGGKYALEPDEEPEFLELYADTIKELKQNDLDAEAAPQRNLRFIELVKANTAFDDLPTDCSFKGRSMFELCQEARAAGPAGDWHERLRQEIQMQHNFQLGYVERAFLLVEQRTHIFRFYVDFDLVELDPNL